MEVTQTIKIKIGSNEFELSQAEAEELFDKLNEMLVRRLIPVPANPPVDPIPWPPNPPTTPNPPWTWPPPGTAPDYPWQPPIIYCTTFNGELL